MICQRGIPMDRVRVSNEPGPDRRINKEGELMHKLYISRTQWAVGNGFFHSGTIGSEANMLTYVYDCGALNKTHNQAALAREIEEFADRNPRVDVCFISHFDFDHVSGISRLSSSSSVSRFVIPLLPVRQRLFALARQLGQGLLDPGQDSSDLETYLEFIIDPVAALQDLAEPDGESDGPSVVPVEPDDEPSDRDSPQSDEEEVRRMAYTSPTLLNPRQVGSANQGPLLLELDNGRMGIAGSGSRLWEWRYSVAGQMRPGAVEFTDSLIAQGLIKTGGDLADHSVVRDLVLQHHTGLVQAYDDAVRTVGSSFTRNLTSLALYSGPPLGSPYYSYRSRANAIERAEIGAWNPRPGWLGLGDSDIRSNARLNDINATWADYKPHVSTFAPSHHGSKLDWHAQLAQGFSHGGDYSPTFVFSASGEWKHPEHEVLLEINELGGTAIIVGLDERSRWTESITAYVGS